MHNSQETVHEDGRKDVTISVNMVEVPKDADEATRKASDVINNEIIPALANEMFHVVLHHKPTGEYVQATLARKDMNPWVKSCIHKFYERKMQGYHITKYEDFSMIVFSLRDKNATVETPNV
jgi:hypothetical protein